MAYGSNSSLTLVASLFATACAGEDSPGMSGSGMASDTDGATTSAETDAGTGSTSSQETLQTDSASGGSEGSGDSGNSSGQDSDDASGDETSTGDTGPSEVMLGGRTEDFIGVEAIPGTSLRIFGMDGITDVADDDGNFELGPLPPDTPVAIVLDAITVDDIDYVGAIVPERTGTMDRDDAVATQINQTIIDEQIEGIADQMPQPPDLEQAIVIAMVHPSRGGESLADGTVTVDMQPPPAAGTFYAPDETGDPVLDSTEIGYDFLPAAVFFNLPDTDPGEITVTAEHEQPNLWDCSVTHSEWPTLGAHTTFVLVTCAST